MEPAHTNGYRGNTERTGEPLGKILTLFPVCADNKVWMGVVTMHFWISEIEALVAQLIGLVLLVLLGAKLILKELRSFRPRRAPKPRPHPEKVIPIHYP